MSDITEVNNCVKPNHIRECPKGRRAIFQPNRCEGCEWDHLIFFDNHLRREVSAMKQELQEIKELLKELIPTVQEISND